MSEYYRIASANVTLPVEASKIKFGGLYEFRNRDFTARSFTAVSYTHLRAHETVLDLVCRLLLEKKKNNKKYIISTYTILNNKSISNIKNAQEHD